MVWIQASSEEQRELCKDLSCEDCVVVATAVGCHETVVRTGVMHRKVMTGSHFQCHWHRITIASLALVF